MEYQIYGIDKTTPIWWEYCPSCGSPFKLLACLNPVIVGDCIKLQRAKYFCGSYYNHNRKQKFVNKCK